MSLWAAVSRRQILHDAVESVRIWFVLIAAAPPGTESPTEAVRGTVNQVLSILEDPVLKDPTKLKPRRHMLEEVIATRFDYAEMLPRRLGGILPRRFHLCPITTMEMGHTLEQGERWERLKCQTLMLLSTI